jgi:hypothetical protein
MADFVGGADDLTRRESHGALAACDCREGQAEVRGHEVAAGQLQRRHSSS